MSLVTHAVSSMGIVSLIPLNILTKEYQSKDSVNASDYSSREMSLSPVFEQELQKNKFLKYFKILDDYQNQIENSKSSLRQLLQVEQQLKAYKLLLNQCIEDAQSELIILQREIDLLKDTQSIDYLKNMNEKHKYLYQLNYNNLSICRFLNYRIKGLNSQIQQYYDNIYFASFTTKYMNILQIFQKMSFHQLHDIPKGYVIEQFVLQSRLFTNLTILLLGFGLLLGLKVLRSKYQMVSILRDLNLVRFMHVLLVFILLSPVIYLLLKINYAHHDEVLLHVYKKPMSMLIFFNSFLYLYFFFNRAHLKMDLFVAIPSIFFQFSLVFLTMRINFYNVSNNSVLQTLYVKYLLLVGMQFLLLCQFYWLMIRALEIKKIRYILLVYVSVLFLIFIFGLNGYVDMAINLDYAIILSLVLLVWMILWTHFRNYILHTIKHVENFKHKFTFLTDFDFKRVAINFEILVNLIYFVLLTQFIIITLVSNFWFYSKDIIYQWYVFFYHVQTIGAYHFVLINYIYAIIVFLCLNILNHFLSYYVSKKLLNNKMSIQKTAQIFYWVGTVFILIICSLIVGFDLKSIFFLVGALLLGIGFGMKNILMDLFSGVIIFLNRPFELGDLINIDQHKGYVYKIGLFEIIIKNLDNDMIILPNQFVATSVIENYTFNNKKAHAVHLIYLIDKIQDKDEKLLNTIILKVLKYQKQLVKVKDQYFQCILSPDIKNLGAFQMELIIFLNDLKNVKSKSNQINIQILEALNENHLNVQFIGMSHALNDG